MTRVPAWVVDVGLAITTAVVLVVTISVAQEPASRAADLLAYALGLGVAGLLLVRRRWPTAVLLASVALLFLYYSLQYPGFSPALGLAVALYTVAAAGRLRWGALAVASVFGAEVLARISGAYPEPRVSVILEALETLSLLVALLLLGDAVRSRRALVTEAGERARLESAERERETERRVAEERLRIARELHDVIAHTVAVITVQAGVAADVLDESPAVARSALQTIRTASREAMDELSSTVGLLRDGDRDREPSPLAPAPGLDQLDGLVEVAAAAGVKVEVSIAGDPRALPAAIDLTAYRIVQESLTNVLRHAHATAATVAIDYQPAAVVIEVSDDGRGLTGTPDGGYGLAGMRERATALGGRFQAGAVAGGGYRVHAWLPADRGPQR